MGVDKIVTTSVASNVVDTDNLLKSRGIAEFDGVINSSADVFVEEGSKVNVAEGASVQFQPGSTLKIKSGANLEMATGTTVKMMGDVELDLNKVVFVDGSTGRKYRIGFRDGHESEGGGVVMTYSQLTEEEAASPKQIADDKESASRELVEKLKTLGI
jgi:hypothetical protein